MTLALYQRTSRLKSALSQFSHSRKTLSPLAAERGSLTHSHTLTFPLRPTTLLQVGIQLRTATMKEHDMAHLVKGMNDDVFAWKVDELALGLGFEGSALRESG
jgi:hypothetical protein